MLRHFTDESKAYLRFELSDFQPVIAIVVFNCKIKCKIVIIFVGFMPYEHKDLRFLRDPKLFDPFRKK